MNLYDSYDGKVTRTYYRIILEPNFSANKEYFKEIITKRKASRYLVCYECGEWLSSLGWEYGKEKKIKKGDIYIRDEFYYYTDFGVRKKVNFICRNCWNAEVPIGITRNWKRKVKIIE